MGDVVIIAPHGDDEVIGCFDVLEKYNENNKIAIVYGPDMENHRKEELLKLKEYYSCLQLIQNIVPQHLVQMENKFYFPNPTDEMHPDHRKWAQVGEGLARNGLDVTFYTIQMNVPYIYKVENPDKKLEVLNYVYPSQNELWNNDKKYILFEGYCKWVF